MVHLYCGDGKGKTTAAMGLALRALGHGRRVAIVQFLKDGTSGELESLRRLGAAVYACPNAKFTRQMSETDRACARAEGDAALRGALAAPFDMLILDEVCAAHKNGLTDERLLRRAVALGKEDREIVLTGRDPAAWMREAADYVTEMRAEKHPYTQGVPAREGVEY